MIDDVTDGEPQVPLQIVASGSVINPNLKYGDVCRAMTTRLHRNFDTHSSCLEGNNGAVRRSSRDHHSFALIENYNSQYPAGHVVGNGLLDSSCCRTDCGELFLGPPRAWGLKDRGKAC
jgi:hypothetical protein